MTTPHDNGAATSSLTATLSPCGTLATVTCPRCGNPHVHGWSADADFDARPRAPLCDREAKPYRVEVGR